MKTDFGNGMNKEARSRISGRERMAPRPAPTILIVDDDADSALLLESVFAHLGCRTACSLDPAEAKRRICSFKADLIILDWVLGEDTDAKGITEQCEKVFAKFGIRNGKQKKPKIVTCSSLDFERIGLLRSPCFEHLDHWQKPLPQSELLKRGLRLLEEI